MGSKSRNVSVSLSSIGTQKWLAPWHNMETNSISCKKCFNQTFYTNLQVSFNFKNTTMAAGANMQILACKICHKLMICWWTKIYFDFNLCIKIGRASLGWNQYFVKHVKDSGNL